MAKRHGLFQSGTIWDLFTCRMCSWSFKNKSKLFLHPCPATNMSSSNPYATKLTLEDEEDSPSFQSSQNEQVGEPRYSENYKKFMDKFTLTNHKVRYYCNKTLSMRQPINDILNDLVKLQYHSMAYLPQDTNQTDHYALSMTLTLISKTATMIDWSKLNHDCFWKDFGRETRGLKYLINRIQGVTLECVHTVTDKANRALEILEGVVTIGKKNANPHLKDTMFQSSGDPSLEGIKVIWMEPRDTIIIQWKDIENGIQSTKLQHTGDSFRLRFLRCLIFYARKSLQLILFTMLRIDVTLRFEFPLQKLEKCQGLTPGQLLPHERSALSKAKLEFDGNWDDIWGTVNRFKIQLDQLQEHKANLKQLRKDPKSSGKMDPYADSLILQIEDPLLLKVVRQGLSAEMKKESYDFTMFPDRTEDIFSMIEDMWSVDKTPYKKMDLLVILLYSALSHVQPVLNKKEEAVFRKDVNDLFTQRNTVKRYLNIAMDVFKHSAFGAMTLNQNGYKKVLSRSGAIRFTRSDSLDETEDEDEDTLSEDDEQTQVWVDLAGGYKVTISDDKEFLVLNPFKEQLPFNHLDEEQQVVLSAKILARLMHHVAIEGCRAKIVVERARETKSLLKRMKSRDRSIEYLGAVIGNGVYHIQQLLKLMKTMEVIRSIPL